MRHPPAPSHSHDQSLLLDRLPLSTRVPAREPAAVAPPAGSYYLLLRIGATLPSPQRDREPLEAPDPPRECCPKGAWSTASMRLQPDQTPLHRSNTQRRPAAAHNSRPSRRASVTEHFTRRARSRPCADAPSRSSSPCSMKECYTGLIQPMRGEIGNPSCLPRCP